MIIMFSGPLLAPDVSAGLRTLQSLDDAIAFRMRRMTESCDECAPGQRCADHAGDEKLVTAYRREHGEVLRRTLDTISPGDAEHALQESAGIPPTVLATSLALATRLRELAADGPVVTDLGDGPVLVTLRDGVLVEQALSAAGDDPAPTA
jgi:hypothetical protein